jgi:uncharacterized membrane protein
MGGDNSVTPTILDFPIPNPQTKQMTVKPLYPYLAGLALLTIIVGLVFAPAAETMLGSAGQLAAASRLAFRPFCHQDPARSIALAGAVLPVCARCTGIYLGAWLGWAIWWFAPHARRDRPVSNLVLILGLGPLVIDGLLNTFILTSPASVRLITGLLGGATAARAVWPALLQALSAFKHPRAALGRAQGR